jgi:hypothetical protein
MNGKTIEESRQAYRNSPLEGAMWDYERWPCTRCYCCEVVIREGVWACTGGCDEKGHHDGQP